MGLLSPAQLSADMSMSATDLAIDDNCGFLVLNGETEEEHTMPRNLIFCFDGTCNEPADAAQDNTRSGGLEDNNISNILKLHLLFGGDLKDGNAHQLPQQSLYYPGVGTYGSKLKRLFNAGLALTEVGRIIDDGLKDLDRHYQKGDRIFVFGFSRGAAIARRFCSVLSKATGHKPKRVRVTRCCRY